MLSSDNLVKLYSSLVESINLFQVVSKYFKSHDLDLISVVCALGDPDSEIKA